MPPPADRHVEAFLEMLAAERGAAPNTLAAYETDLNDFAAHARSRGQDAATADAATARGWLEGLAAAGKAARTQARKLSALRRASGNLLETGVDSFGRRALYYDGIAVEVAP